MIQTTVSIKPFDLKSASEREYERLNVFFNRMRAERLPDDPPISLDENIRSWQNIPPFVYLEGWAVWTPDAAGIVATGTVDYLLTEENKHVIEFSMDVLPEFRRQGLAKQLLANIAAVGRRENRTLMLSNTNERIPAGEAFMQRIGARKGLESHTNQLDFAALNPDLVQQWIAQAQARAADFELGFWNGAFPAEEIEAVAALYEVMNQQPRGTLEVEDFHFTPEHIRQMEKGWLARGTEHWTMFVREKSSGKFAGFTDVFWHPNRPDLLNQGNTGVFPEYRNRGLGRWLKAAMLDKVLRERPQVQRIRTGNADANAPMLKINHELGFKPYISNTTWQIETDKVLAYLGLPRMASD